MRTPASISKHPIHPMPIVFPIGLWIFSLVCDLIHLAGASGTPGRAGIAMHARGARRLCWVHRRQRLCAHGLARLSRRERNLSHDERGHAQGYGVTQARLSDVEVSAFGEA
jgi:hypothetical protein